MKKFLLMFLFYFLQTYSAFEIKNLSARAIIFGAGYVSLKNEISNFSEIQNTKILLTYSPQIFGFNELTNSSATVATKTNYGNLSLKFHQLGFDLYKEITPTFSYSNSIEGINFGTNLNYHFLSIKNYGNDKTFSIDFGLRTNISENLAFGFFAQNLNGATISESKEKLPQKFCVGIAFAPIENFVFAYGIEKNVLYEISQNIGSEFYLVENFAIRLGASNNPQFIKSGFSVKLFSFDLDYTNSYHQILGATHFISIILDLKKF